MDKDGQFITYCVYEVFRTFHIVSGDGSHGENTSSILVGITSGWRISPPFWPA
jgi:hypothetical protein